MKVEGRLLRVSTPKPHVDCHDGKSPRTTVAGVFLPIVGTADANCREGTDCCD
jgi:hypothetical protein